MAPVLRKRVWRLCLMAWEAAGTHGRGRGRKEVTPALGLRSPAEEELGAHVLTSVTVRPVLALTKRLKGASLWVTSGSMRSCLRSR